MDGNDLAAFQNVILHGIEDEQMPEEEERGLMAYFDGSDAVNEKVISLFPCVEKVDGKLYAVTVCQINGTLTPDELAELKEYCHSQYNDAWARVSHSAPGERSTAICTSVFIPVTAIPF